MYTYRWRKQREIYIFISYYVFAINDILEVIFVAIDKHQRKRMKWISVDQEMPEFNIPILIFDEVELVCVSFYDRKNEEFLTATFPYHRYKNVSHWMPCPKYPANKEEEV